MRKKVAAYSSIILSLLLCVVVFQPVPAYAFVGETLVQWLFYIPISISGFLLWVAGMFLNFVLDYTVINLKTNLDGITGITVAWKVIRDLANMSFIFVLLYAAIETILGIGGDWKKTVIGVVTAAILINFSMFFTRVLIDISNIITLLFYQVIVPGGDMKLGITNHFMDALGLTSVYSLQGSELLKDMGIERLAIVAIGGTILILTTAFVFFAAAIMFAIRYVNIIFLLVFSPIAVLSGISSSSTLSGNIKKWWGLLSSQLIFAPVFMILMWVVITLLNNGISNTSDISGSAAAFSGLFSKNDSSIGTIFNFVIIIGLTIGALVTAKDVAKQGGTAGQKIVGGVLGFGSAGIGKLGRTTVGRGANWLDKNGKLNAVDKAAAGKGFIGSIRQSGLRGVAQGAKTYAARAAAGSVRGTAAGSMDVRKPLNLSAGLLDQDLGIGNQFSKAGAGGFVAEQKAKSDANKARQERVRQNDQKIKTKADEEAIKAGLAEANRALAPGVARTNEEIARIDAMEAALGNMTDKEIETLVESNNKLLEDPTFSDRLSSRQLEAINKSDKFTEQDKNKLKKLRFRALYTGIAEANRAVPAGYVRTPAEQALIDGVKPAVQNLTEKELEMIDSQTLRDPEFIRNLKQNQVEKMGGNNKFTTSQQEALKNARKSENEGLLNTTPSQVKKIHPKELKEVDIGILTSDAVVDQLNIKTVRSLGDNLSSEKAEQLHNAIVARPAAAGSQLEKLQNWLNGEGQGTLV